jgi:hypothetical protein
MSKPVKTGGTTRTNLEIAAERGNAKAIALLQGPEQPYELQHLWMWHQMLRRGLGDPTENGPASLTWVQFEAAQRVMHMRPYMHEILALFDMDMVYRDPEILERLKAQEQSDGG